MIYAPIFDTSSLSLGTMTLATAGKSNVVITLGSITGPAVDNSGNVTKFFHHSTNSIFEVQTQDEHASPGRGDFSGESWGKCLKSALQAAALAQGWATPSNLVVTFSTTNGLYTISYSATFSITWSSAVGRALCGFSADVSGTNLYTGTVVPTYAIKSTLDAVSLPTPNYEPDSIATHVVPDQGYGGYGTKRHAAPLYRDWTQQFELKAKTQRLFAASTHPFTFQHLFENCRGGLPFVVIRGFGSDTALDEVFSLRSEGTRWNPERGAFMDDATFHIPFKTVVEGTLTAS